jgi:hypothetical protein
MVTFIVGEEPAKHTLVVHERLATISSRFFRAAFDGRFVEGGTQTRRLDDVDDGVFGTLIHWLYTKKLVSVFFGSEE